MEPLHSYCDSIQLDVRSKGAAGAKHARPLAGFTLVELMVVLAIIVSVMSIVLTSQTSFNKTIILANTAYDVALSLRSAETYGLGGHTVGSTPTGYGLHFTTATPSSYTLFADTSPALPTISACHLAGQSDPSALDAQPGNCSYEASDALVTSYALGNNITVSDFCAFTDSWSCTYAHDGYAGGLSSLDIVFARPNADPLMSVGGAYSTLSPVTSACITLSSSQGGSRFVTVAASGEISASATSCP